jgi:hypothetical protein
VECVCTERVALQRLQADAAGKKHVAANRNAKLYRAVKQKFEKIQRGKLVVRTSLQLETSVKKVREYLGR